MVKYLGGPHDNSLLTNYVDHVAYELWESWVSNVFSYFMVDDLFKFYIQFLFIVSRGDKVGLMEINK